MFHDEKNGVALSSKASFLVGLAGGVLLLCTIGFFILLGIVLSGDDADSKQAVANKPTVGAPTAEAPADENTLGPVKEVDSDDHLRGAKKGEITLVSYSDFECPYCANFHSTMQQLMADPEYKDNIRWVYRHFPLSFHANAKGAAIASECAADQGKFWEYADKLVENQSSLSSTLYETLATDLGLNVSKFKTCLADPDTAAKVTADQTIGGTAGVSGTPATIILIDGAEPTLIPGAYPLDQVKAMIASLQ